MIENKIYNPAAQPKEWLIENFVVRTNVFEKIFKDIKTIKFKTKLLTKSTAYNKRFWASVAGQTNFS